MNVVEELEAVLTHAEGLTRSNPTAAAEKPLSTQQLLDELLGHFDDEDSLIC